MRKSNAARARELDWTQFKSPHMPSESVVYPKGEEKLALIERIRAAFRKVKQAA